MTITWDATTGWSLPDLCPWACNDDFHGFDGGCRANVAFDDCYIQWPPTVEEWVRRDVDFYGRVVTSASPDGDEIPGLKSQVCFADAPLEPGFSLDDLTCEEAVLNTEASGPDPEYMATVQFEVEADLDYVFAFSGDGGTTWKACDLDGIVGDGSVNPGSVDVWGVPRNNGFEDWDSTGMPIAWTKAADTGVAREDEVVREGDHAVRLTRQSTSNAGNEFSANLAPVDGDVDYTFTMNVFDNDPNARVNIAFQWYDEAGASLAGASYGTIYTEDSDEWQALTRTAKSPTAARFVRVLTRVYAQSGGTPTGGSVVVDGYLVEPTPEE